LILADSQVTGPSGTGLVQSLQEAGRSACPKILMLRYSEQKNGLDRYLQPGVAACLIKPIRRMELKAALLAALGARLGSVEPVPAAPPEPPAPAEQKTAVPLRILLAEDNPVNQRVARALLQRWGYTVSCANNGIEAVRLLDEQTFDLVLMDVQMPEMNGFEATAAIRAREAGTGQHLPVIAMTAHAMKGDRENCLQAGMDAYVSKPIKPDLLAETIESMRSGMVQKAS
jgi:CheY-like chemotaxis protein